MKKFCLLVLTLFAVFAMQAQEAPVSPDASQAKEKSGKPVKKIRYQTEIDLSYAYGIEDEISYLNLEWVNGVRFNRYFFAGVGGGASANFEDEGVLVPLYVDLRGYAPGAKKVDFMFGVNLGTKLDCNYGMSGGFLLRPEFGIATRFTEKFGMNFAVRYELYSLGYDVANMTGSIDRLRLKTNLIGLKIGFEF